MYNKVDTSLNFAEREKKIVEFWKQNDIIHETMKARKDGAFYSFFEGPPTANGKPHIGHVLTRTIKDVFLRYNTMLGKNLLRKGGWDTHGLPVEIEVEKMIGSSGKQDIEKYGIEPFIAKCKESVWKYKDMWEEFSMRMGYSVDTDDAYITYDNNYIESVWWSLAELHKKGLVYKGHRIVPYCPRCGASLSSHEVAQGYKDVKERTVFAKFKALDQENTYYIAWTTTPWTLPSNVALCMHKDYDYVTIEMMENGERYILAEALVPSIFEEGTYKVVSKAKGVNFEGKFYEPLFDFVYDKYKGQAWKLVLADYVTLDSGSGIVHIAPAFGEEDNKVGKEYNLPFVQLVDDRGNLTQECGEFAGVFAKTADPMIIKSLKQSGKLLKDQMHVHSYPHCWRCDTPLLYYARSSWFVATTKKKDELIKANEKVDWKPKTIGEGRMGGFLSGLIDWDIARNRYWGTPLPFWVCDCGHIHVVGSREELYKLSGDKKVLDMDLHKPAVDTITFKCDKCNGVMKRTPEVLDCWYDSGSMPFAQLHYPFENKELFEKSFPAEFISEGMDQTRGWFYSLLAVNTLLFGKAPYKRCLPLGLVNDEHGKKMSKHLGNVVTPTEMFESVGSDAVRWYFYISNSPWLGTSFKKETLEDFERKFMGTLWNTYAFFVLYADIDKFDGSKHNIYNEDLSFMDKWVISEFNQLVHDVRKYLDEYVSYEPAKLIANFVDSLSNWYVRRSRERFWVSGETKDKTAAFTTLYYCLTGLVKLVAPFVPALSEEIYQNLVRCVDKNAPISVHMCDYPVADEKLIDKNLNQGMEAVLEVVILGRGARNASENKNRQPLSSLLVATKRKLGLTDELIQLIKEELNVLDVKLISDAKEYISYEIKPQLKTVGPKYGPLVGAIRNHLISADGEKIVEQVENGGIYSFDVNGVTVELAENDMLITPVSKTGYNSLSANGITVILNTTLTEELKELGFVRELVSRVQNTRKTAGFEVVDHINIYVQASSELLSVITKYKEDICNDTLADTLSVDKLCGFTAEVEIAGQKFVIGLEKVVK